jgi:hypothetical protein
MSAASQLDPVPRDAPASLLRSLTHPSPRERWLMAGLGLAALVTAAVFALQWSQGQRDRLAAAQADLMLARQSRALAARASLDDFDLAQLRAQSSWSTHGETIWLVRLKIEQRLNAAAVSAGLPAPTISIGEGLEEGAGTPLLRAEITGPYVSAAWVRFLDQLASGAPAFVVGKLDVSSAETAQYRLVLLFPVVIDRPGPAPAESAPVASP